jgi:hypothetical protein
MIYGFIHEDIEKSGAMKFITFIFLVSSFLSASSIDLKNITLNISELTQQPIKFVDGVYDGRSEDMPLNIIISRIAVADLNNDNKMDAARARVEKDY